jgi:hypothetical protein
MPRVGLASGLESRVGAIHEISAGATMDVKIDKPGDEEAASQVDRFGCRYDGGISLSDSGDSSLPNEQVSAKHPVGNDDYPVEKDGLSHAMRFPDLATARR